jgi:hypothetical protein
MINIVVFEDQWTRHSNAKAMIAKIFEGYEIQIQCYLNWLHFQKSDQFFDGTIDYAFLDHNLGNDKLDRTINGNQVKQYLLDSGHNPRFISISSSDPEYVDANIGKIPDQDEMYYQLSEEAIRKLRVKVCPNLAFPNENTEDSDLGELK